MDTKKTYFNLRIKKSCKNDFLNLYNDYRNYANILGFSLGDFFSVGVSFLHKKYENQKLIKSINKDFEVSTFKRGKRMNSPRTPLESEAVDINVIIDSKTYKEYKDLCFVFVKSFHNSMFITKYYSKAFFFYDLVNELKKNRNDLINYNVYKN